MNTVYNIPYRHSFLHTIPISPSDLYCTQYSLWSYYLPLAFHSPSPGINIHISYRVYNWKWKNANRRARKRKVVTRIHTEIMRHIWNTSLFKMNEKLQQRLGTNNIIGKLMYFYNFKRSVIAKNKECLKRWSNWKLT